jgi:hypothetical protein
MMNESKTILKELLKEQRLKWNHSSKY